ncbi:hypothetical protein [Marinicella rhabdoformis]|uniref:hypothetical protein n=1 Tax=Marinicella rhabdoformis TaxID=2580566 RepID=UPI0012AED2AA|nr:hypothetical protein [Marinicella rhabdoformis]
MIKKIKQLFILSAVSASCMPVNAELLLKLDEATLGNTPMPISENIDYDILGHQVQVTTKYPMICNQIEGSATASQLTVAVNSPNKDSATSGLVGLLQSIDYDIAGGKISMQSENLNKSLCLASTLHDVIHESAFEGNDWEQEYSNHFSFTGIQESRPVNTLFTVGTEYVNTTGMVLELDYIDFWPSSELLDVYANHNGTFCEIYDDQEDLVGSCPVDLNERGKYANIWLQPGYKIVTTNNLVIHPSSVVGKNLYLMTAVFTKVNTIQSGGQNQSFSGVEFIEAKIKVAPTP